MSATTLSVMIAKVSKTTNGKPYAATAASKGGNFCIFPKVGDEKAAKLVAGLVPGKFATLENVAIYNGGVIVYGDTVVSQ